MNMESQFKYHMNIENQFKYHMNMENQLAHILTNLTIIHRKIRYENQEHQKHILKEFLV